ARAHCVDGRGGTRDGARQLPGEARGELLLLHGRPDERGELLERHVTGAEELGRLLAVALCSLRLPELGPQRGEELPQLLADLGRGVAVLGLLEREIDRVEPARDGREAGLRLEDAALRGIAGVIGAEVTVGAGECGAGEAAPLGTRLDAVAGVVVVARRGCHRRAESCLAGDPGAAAERMAVEVLGAGTVRSAAEAAARAGGVASCARHSVLRAQVACFPALGDAVAAPPDAAAGGAAVARRRVA